MLPLVTHMPRRRRHRTSFVSLKIPASLSGAILLVIGFISGYVYFESQTPKIFASTNANPKIQVCFSPEGNCEKLVIQAIQASQKQILVQAYAFTSEPIAEALIEAHQRGIQVRMLYDRTQVNTSHSKISLLQQADIETNKDLAIGLAHSKVMIIDDSVLTGSFNWTRDANTRNAENLLLIHDPSLAHIYEDNWLARYNR